MELTAHAEARAQQRGFTEKDLEIIVSLGVPKRKAGGAVEYCLTKAVKQKEVTNLKRQLQRLERLAGKAVVLSEDGVVITAYPVH